MQLGDLINGPFADFDAVLPVLGKLAVPVHHVLGNHDVAVEPQNKGKVLAKLGLDKLGAGKGYYDFAHAGWRLVVLNGNDISLHAHLKGTDEYKEAERIFQDLRDKGARNAQFWNGAIGAGQLADLARKLDRAAAAGERTIVFCHFPIYPAGTHTLWNDAAVLDVIGSHKGVVAYMAGHYHDGECAAKGGTHFLTFAGMVETQETACALVEVFADRLQVTGFGREPTRTLAT